MNKYIIFSGLCALFVATVAIAPRAHALSCLPLDMYLKDVVGKEEIVIFTGTSVDRMDKTDHTAEVITVTEAKQGYVEKDIFVYHQKEMTWGYMCNSGPKEKGSTGVYIAERNDLGKYNVYQRLETSDPLVKALDADLKKAEVTGGISELSKTDRMNQIMTTVTDLLKEISILLTEYVYWKN